MFLYNLSLNPPTAINKAIYGNFSGTKQQEIIVARHTRLELLRPDPTTGKVHTVLAHDCFGLVRSISPFRLTGGSKGKPSGFLDVSSRDIPVPLLIFDLPFQIMLLSAPIPVASLFSSIIRLKTRSIKFIRRLMENLDFEESFQVNTLLRIPRVAQS